MRISTKITMMYIVLGFIVVLVTRTISFLHTRHVLENEIYQKLQVVSQEKAGSVNYYLEMEKKGIEQLARYSLNAEVLKNINTPEKNAILEKAIREYEEISNESEGIYEVFLIDMNGVIVASNDQDKIGLDRSNDAYFTKGVNQTFIKDIYFSDTTHRETLSIATPVYDNENKNEVIGVLVERLNLQELREKLESNSFLGETGESYLINKNGYMITPSRFIEDVILKVRIDRDKVCKEDQDRDEKIKAYENYRGKDVLGAYAKIPETQWILVTEIDAKEILAPLQRVFRSFLFLLLSSPFLIWIVGIFAGKVIEKPINELVEGIEIIGKGDLTHKFDDKRKDELGVMAKAFNDMTDNLQKTMTSREELQKVNKELDGFVYTASHDLRAPLRGISSFATFLEEDYNDKIDEQGKDYINEIRKGAERMSALIEDLLKLSRVSRIKNPYEEADMNELLNAAILQIEFLVKENKVNMVVPAGLPKVYCDPIKIKEALVNLVNNAIKFSSKDNNTDPKIEIGYEDKGDKHEFFVKDNGIGIEEKYHEKIFESFQRLHTSAQYEGTGVGLNLVKRIIEEHCGELWVESKVGEGTIFYFTIPKDIMG